MTTIKVKRIQKFVEPLWGALNRTIVLYGGAGSGKSHATAQRILNLFYSGQDLRILVVRKTGPALRITAFQLLLDLLEEMKLPYTVNYSDMVIRNPRGNIIFCKSLDNPEKIKSFQANYIWVEEATDIEYTDYLQLNLRLRRVNVNPGWKNQIFLTFNPIDEHHWLVQHFIRGKPDDNVLVHHSTYLDNPFLDEEYVQELIDLVEKDINFYRIYTLGEPGVLTNKIYHNYVTVPRESWPVVPSSEKVYGIDFGYTRPSAVVSLIFAEGDAVYVKEELYQTHLTNSDLIEKLKEIDPAKRGLYYADSAEPDRIEEIRQAGFDIHPAFKNIKLGIDRVKRRKLYIHEDSVNTLKEINNYKYREDRDGSALEEPVQFQDHCFVAGTRVITTRGEIPIETVMTTDRVLTRNGFMPVVASGLTGIKPIYEMRLVDGRTLYGTGNHPIFVEGKGFIPMDTLRYGDVVKCNPMSLYSTEFRIGGIQNRNGVQTGHITDLPRITSHRDTGICIKKSGNSTTVRYPMVTTSTTKTKIPPTMTFQTSNAFPVVYTYPYMQANCHKTKRLQNGEETISTKLDQKRQNGTVRKKAGNGIANMRKRHISQSKLRKRARIVENRSLTIRDSLRVGFAPMPANLHIVGKQELMTLPTHVSIAEGYLAHPDSNPESSVLDNVRVATIRNTGYLAPVYNLTVANTHEFFANGILVHNCMDALRYGISSYEEDYELDEWSWF